MTSDPSPDELAAAAGRLSDVAQTAPSMRLRMDIRLVLQALVQAPQGGRESSSDEIAAIPQEARPADIGSLLEAEIDACIEAMNRLTGAGEDYIWRPANRTREVLIKARDTIQVLVQGEPVAWRVKDFADGWMFASSEAQARDYAKHGGNLVQPLYAAPLPPLNGGDGLDREAVARIIDPGEWQRRDSYLMMMAATRDQRGGATSKTIDAIAAARVERSTAKADAILALAASPSVGERTWEVWWDDSTGPEIDGLPDAESARRHAAQLEAGESGTTTVYEVTRRPVKP